MSGSVERVRGHLRSRQIDADFREFDASTKNSTLAARALGCSVAEIAKSVVLCRSRAFVVVISGDKRVDTNRLSSLTGESARVATPEEVRSMTGYPIGGVPPFPHLKGVEVLCDKSLLRFEKVWAAGGAPNVVFSISPAELIKEAGGGTVDVSERS